MRKLENKNSTNFDIIREYVSGESKGIELNEIQKEQLARWNFYINLKLQGQLSTGDIVKKMMDQFDVQRATCFNDMGYAEALFGYNASLNKRFRIGARIDFLEEKIHELWNAEKIKITDEDGDEKEILIDFETRQANRELAARLEGHLQKYYDIYPEMKQQRSPRTIIYNFTKNEYNTEALPDIEEAEAIIEKELNQ